MCSQTCHSLHLETNPFLAAALPSHAKPSSPTPVPWVAQHRWCSATLAGFLASRELPEHQGPAFPPPFTCHLPVACRPGCDLTPYFPERIALRGDTPTPLSPTPRFPSVITGLCGTGTHNLHSSFSRQREFSKLPTYFRSSRSPALVCVLHYIPASLLSPGYHSPTCLSFCVTASVKQL